MTKIQRNIIIVILSIGLFVALINLAVKVGKNSDFFPENNVGILERRSGVEFVVVKNYDVGVQDKICASETVERLKNYTFDESNYIAAKYGAFNQFIYRGLTSETDCVMVISSSVSYYLDENQSSPYSDTIYVVYHYDKHNDKYTYLDCASGSYINSKFDKDVYGSSIYTYACYCELKYY